MSDFKDFRDLERSLPGWPRQRREPGRKGPGIGITVPGRRPPPESLKSLKSWALHTRNEPGV